LPFIYFLSYDYNHNASISESVAYTNLSVIESKSPNLTTSSLSTGVPITWALPSVNTLNAFDVEEVPEPLPIINNASASFLLYLPNTA
jgi:hypothetical protein